MKGKPMLHANPNQPLQIAVPPNCTLSLEDCPDPIAAPVIDGSVFTATEPGVYRLAFINESDPYFHVPLKIEVS